MFSFLRNYFTDYLSSLPLLLIAGRKDYAGWKRKSYALKKAVIQNKPLARELEKRCKEKQGFLTFAEFLDEEQFGTYGYHATHKLHGETRTHQNWPQAIATLCEQKGYKHIIELGPGEGKLAVATLKQAKKRGLTVRWSGIEVNQRLQKIIRLNFKKNNLEDSLMQLCQTVDELSIPEKSLLVFSYSLDSIPPEIFVTTGKSKSFPDSIIGVTITNDLLEERTLTAVDLVKKQRQLTNGIYTDARGEQFDLRTWLLLPGQRAYIPIQAFSLLSQLVKKSRGSDVLILDEFRMPPRPWETLHLCTPRALTKFTRDRTNSEKAYQEAGRNLYYYPTYASSLTKFLHALGFRSILADAEQHLAKTIIGEKNFTLKGFHFTLGFFATQNQGKVPHILPIEFPQTTLF